MSGHPQAKSAAGSLLGSLVTPVQGKPRFVPKDKRLRLTASAHVQPVYDGPSVTDYARLHAENEALAQSNRRLRETAEPIAQFAKAILHDEDRKDDSVIVGKVIRDPAGDWGGRITFGDCRRVIAAFRYSRPSPPNE